MRPEIVIAHYYEGNHLLHTILELAYLSVKDAGSSTSVPGSPYFARFVTNMLMGAGTEIFPEAAAPGAHVRWRVTALGPRIRIAEHELQLGEPLQDPGLLLDHRMTELALSAYEASVEILLRKSGSTRVCVVYIPSPLASYRLLGPVSIPSPWLPAIHRQVEQAAIRARSLFLRRRVGAMARELGVRFVDATQVVQHAALSKALHGPRDWRHFNEEGYRLLVETIIR